MAETQRGGNAGGAAGIEKGFSRPHATPRKAGVDPELVKYIQQWKQRGSGSDMRLHYDEIDADDTVGAMRLI